jgi:hypothetical protein
VLEDRPAACAAAAIRACVACHAFSYGLIIGRRLRRSILARELRPTTCYGAIAGTALREL